MSALLPFETTILSVIGAALPVELRDKYLEQVQNINKIQRLLQWHTIEFYCMRWFKVRWPEATLFSDDSEFILGSGQLSAGNCSAPITVWATGGHVFSIESEQPLVQFKAHSQVQFSLVGSAAQLVAQRDVPASGRSAR